MQGFLKPAVREFGEALLYSPLGVVLKPFFGCLQAWYRIRKNHYKEVYYALRYLRIVDSSRPRSRRSPESSCLPPRLVGSGFNRVRDSLIASPESRAYRNEFLSYGIDKAVRLKYPRKEEYPGRQGDLIVLKPCGGKREKGVLLLKYNDSFTKFLSLYDPQKVAASYRIVLEPSTWGYQEPIFHSFLGLGTQVIVQAQHPNDYDFIRTVGQNLIPVRIGAGDWVDPNEFEGNAGGEKSIDLIMVASWLKLKRHELLFKTVRKIKKDLGKIVLVGYPSGGRNLLDVQEEARRLGCLDILEFYERIPPSAVRKLLAQAKGNLLLSKREGASKAAYEGFFCDVPLILSDTNVGFNREHLNRDTGLIATDAGLADAILYLLASHEHFSPRKWALRNTGCFNSTKQLNQVLRKVAEECGEIWQKDIYTKKNMPNLQYVHEPEAAEAEAEFMVLQNFLRR